MLSNDEVQALLEAASSDGERRWLLAYHGPPQRRKKSKLALKRAAKKQARLLYPIITVDAFGVEVTLEWRGRRYSAATEFVVPHRPSIPCTLYADIGGGCRRYARKGNPDDCEWGSTYMNHVSKRRQRYEELRNG